MRFSIFASTVLLATVSSAKVHRRCKASGNSATTQSVSVLPNNAAAVPTSLASSASASVTRTRSRHRHTASASATQSVDAADVAPSSSASASSSGSARTKTRSATGSAASATSSSQSSSGSSGNTSGGDGKVYSVKDAYEGQSFFDGFTFFTASDPTHGLVNYVSQSAATSKNLAYIDDDGTAVLKVDNTNTIAAGAKRDSVRITSKNQYTSGLIVLDVGAMPYGCGTWPAFWTVGANWPNGGEIDIVEGVNTNVQNQYTLHTSSGCTLDASYAKTATQSKRTYSKARHYSNSTIARRGNSASANSMSAMAFTGRVLSTTCDATVNGNSGCGILDPSKASYGSALNAAGGGVFATLLDDSGVAIWFFPRDSIPDDLAQKKPQPSSWSSPKAFWSSSACSTKKFFGGQSIVINTTLCGDWAGNAYSGAGCPGTCAQRVADPKNFDNAQWKINSVIVYQ